MNVQRLLDLHIRWAEHVHLSTPETHPESRKEVDWRFHNYAVFRHCKEWGGVGNRDAMEEWCERNKL